MTEHDLRTALRDHVTTDEPNLTPANDLIHRGRRRQRTRTAFAGAAAVAVLATAGALVVPQLGGSDDRRDDRVIDPAIQEALDNYDALAMPELIAERARIHLGAAAMADLPAPEFRADDAQGQKIGREDWDKASFMTLLYGFDVEHGLRVALYHAKGEVEGDADKVCGDDLDAGYYLSCDVVHLDDGRVAISRVSALRADPLNYETLGEGTQYWYSVTRKELENGKFAPDKIFFDQSVEVIKSETFGTSVSETVHAPTLPEAQAEFQMTQEQLLALADDPQMVMPKPPPGSNGCPAWHKDDNVSCGTTPPDMTEGSGPAEEVE